MGKSPPRTKCHTQYYARGFEKNKLSLSSSYLYFNTNKTFVFRLFQVRLILRKISMAIIIVNIRWRFLGKSDSSKYRLLNGVRTFVLMSVIMLICHLIPFFRSPVRRNGAIVKINGFYPPLSVNKHLFHVLLF